MEFSQKNIAGLSLLIGFITMALDLSIHAFFTTPEETVAYFTAKFALAAFSSVMILEFFRNRSIKFQALFGGVLFLTFTSSYYFYAALTDNTILSCCTYFPPGFNGVPQSTILLLGDYHITTSTLLLGLSHFLDFLVAFTLVIFVATRISE